MSFSWSWPLAGAVLGLFAGAVIWSLALARAAGWATARSAGAWLPLLSFGRARRRLDHAAASHAIVFQAGIALAYALLVARWSDRPGWIVMTILYSVPLLIVLLVDAWTRLIHTNVIAAGVLLALIASSYAGLRQLGLAVAGGIVAAAIFWLFLWLTQLAGPRLRMLPLGLGDVYLAAMLGCMVRFDRVFFALFAGLLLAGLATLARVLPAARGGAWPHSFGPYLCAGALAALLV